MDNLTHSLIGLIAGEALSRTVPVAERGLEPNTRRRLFVTATVIGGNLPDLDLIYSYRGPSAPKLSYLLEHRGYTHTIVGCLILSLLLYGSIAVWLKRRQLIASRVDHGALVGVALLGTPLHLFMDALNSYGVHPFWPFQNRWIYGDSVFIVEPLYWAATAPLIFLLRSRLARCLLAVVLVAAVAAGVISALVPPIMTLCLLVFMALLLWIGWQFRARTAALASAAAYLAVTASFIMAGQIAARRVEALAHAEFPTARLLDHVLTPLPANPLCWDVLVLQISNDTYSSHHAILALAPRLIPAERCGTSTIDRRTLVPQTPPAIRDATAIRWRDFSMSVTTLATLAASSCDAAALMRFARAPFAITAGNEWLLGDLRFDRGPKPGFSVLRIRPAITNRPCPWTPPWDPPRHELLAAP